MPRRTQSLARSVTSLQSIAEVIWNRKNRNSRIMRNFIAGAGNWDIYNKWFIERRLSNKSIKGINITCLENPSYAYFRFLNRLNVSQRINRISVRKIFL
uniref:Uncharacterized protein n=1 Tax=Strigamia maritima TaxID=126957 RepID=T1JPE7_STRMM